MPTDWLSLARAAARSNENKSDEAKALLSELKDFEVYADDVGLHVKPTSRLLAGQKERIKRLKSELIALVQTGECSVWMNIGGHDCAIFGINAADLKANIAMAQRDPFGDI